MPFVREFCFALLTLCAGCTVTTSQARPSPPPPEPAVANAAPMPAPEHRGVQRQDERGRGESDCRGRRDGDACAQRGVRGRCSTERGRGTECVPERNDRRPQQR